MWCVSVCLFSRAFLRSRRTTQARRRCQRKENVPILVRCRQGFRRTGPLFSPLSSPSCAETCFFPFSLSMEKLFLPPLPSSFSSFSCKRGRVRARKRHSCLRLQKSPRAQGAHAVGVRGTDAPTHHRNAVGRPDVLVHTDRQAHTHTHTHHAPSHRGRRA